MKIAFADQDDSPKRKIIKRRNPRREISSLLEPKKKDWWEDEVVMVAYNVPRITARLEGLMGTNVVRLTDRAYMQQLRQSHEADCNAKLQSRIERREAVEKERQNYLVFRGHYTPENCPVFLKLAHSIALAQEMERMRALVVEGKLAKIPKDLATHPVFKTNARTNEIIAQRRSKLKTNREKNAERLIRQGAKWERDRVIFEHLEKEKEEALKARQTEQTGLEEQYRNEDAVRGLDLLRIQDKRWKECELDLKKFLETENAAMKRRFTRKSVQFNSDPLDIKNVIRKGKKFHETQEKVRKHIEESKKSLKAFSLSKDATIQKTQSGFVQRKPSTCHPDGISLDERERFIHSDYGFQSNEDLSAEEMDGQQETVPRQKEYFLKEMDNDIKKGLILTKEQFDALHYEDPLIIKLKQTENVHELYKVAREIICPDTEKFIEKIQEGEAASPR